MSEYRGMIARLNCGSVAVYPSVARTTTSARSAPKGVVTALGWIARAGVCS